MAAPPPGCGGAGHSHGRYFDPTPGTGADAVCGTQGPVAGPGPKPPPANAAAPREPDMILTPDQRDAVTELVNIAFARTAAALSGLAGNRVELTVPEVSAHPIAELLPALGRYVRG